MYIRLLLTFIIILMTDTTPPIVNKISEASWQFIFRAMFCITILSYADTVCPHFSQDADLEYLRAVHSNLCLQNSMNASCLASGICYGLPRRKNYW
jgi:hypothetical protein